MLEGHGIQLMIFDSDDDVCRRSSARSTPTPCDGPLPSRLPMHNRSRVPLVGLTKFVDQLSAVIPSSKPAFIAFYWTLSSASCGFVDIQRLLHKKAGVHMGSLILFYDPEYGRRILMIVRYFWHVLLFLARWCNFLVVPFLGFPIHF